jgi:acyl-CoA hydrolase
MIWTGGDGAFRGVPDCSTATHPWRAHHSVDVVVTEHGCAWLRGELIAVAAPEHRKALALHAEGTS